MTGVPEANTCRGHWRPNRLLRNESAFTLVELMVVLALTAIAMTIIYQTFPAHHKVYLVQDQIVELQQQLRAAMDIMVRDIRMAGYNPRRCSGSGCDCTPGILTAASTSICITQDTSGSTVDLNGDGDTSDPGEEQIPDGLCDDSNETITYEIDTGANGKPCLRRKGSTSGTFQTIAESIEVLDLVYFDENGAVLSTPVAGGDLARVRSIQVTLIARTDREDKDYHNTTVYRNPQNKVLLPAPGDGYRRRLLSTTVQCRNMGL